MALGVAALGSCPRKTDKQGLGEVDVVLQFGGARIVPGQWIFVDASGVVVLDETLAAAGASRFGDAGRHDAAEGRPPARQACRTNCCRS